ncbi:MAG: DUF2326 domain-containing protein [Desulfobacterales bacterium]|nr:DUF2326 domain-containing protein [Desulfobacterales bacterium]
MIHSVSANKASFRTVNFTPGLNVILADRTKSSTQKDTRNGLGKSTLIDIIDFCLGGSAYKGKKLNIEPLQEWAFTLEATIASSRVKITRAVSSANRIIIEGDTTGWPDRPDFDDETSEYTYTLKRWCAVLGWALFGLDLNNDQERYKPSYRSLFSYFVRTKPGAYLDPFKYLPQQKGIISKVNIAFLLGLSWENTSKIQEIEDTTLGLIALESGNVSGVGSIGELETRRIQLEQKTAELASSIKSFKVHPQYQDVQIEADRITTVLHNLANQNVSDRRRLARYKESITFEAPPDTLALEELYEESGLVFNDTIKRTLLEAKKFHRKVVSNRREFLEIEVARIEQSIANRNDEIETLTTQRAESLEILQTHGALQEMTKLQERNTQNTSELSRIKSLINELRTLKQRKRETKTLKTEALKVAEKDHEERRQIWETPIRLFNDNSQALYETPGKLVIDIGDTGYNYRVEIKRSGSEGIDKMKIFCFDLDLLQLQLQTPGKMDFLIHDTLMFDAVDPRQRARALERAEQVTSASNAQYICTMNSDMVPRSDFSEGFDFDRYVRLTLTDKNPSSSLLGIRFERPPKS